MVYFMNMVWRGVGNNLDFINVILQRVFNTLNCSNAFVAMCLSRCWHQRCRFMTLDWQLWFLKWILRCVVDCLYFRSAISHRVFNKFNLRYVNLRYVLNNCDFRTVILWHGPNKIDFICRIPRSDFGKFDLGNIMLRSVSKVVDFLNVVLRRGLDLCNFRNVLLQGVLTCVPSDVYFYSVVLTYLTS